eukprot:546380_1
MIIDDQIVLVHLKNYIIKYTFDIDANICPDAVTAITFNAVQPYDERITAVADLDANIPCVNKRIAAIHKSYTLQFISVCTIDELPYDFLNITLINTLFRL